MNRVGAGVVLVGLALLLAGCGGGLRVEPGQPPASPSRMIGTGMVLDDGDGPELCLGPVAASLPPQCSGPKLIGWRWPTTGVERMSRVTWGNEVSVVGTWDGTRLTVEKTVAPERISNPDPDLRTPCPAPDGGWRAPDPERATAADQERVFAAAARLPGHASSFLDDLGDRRQEPDRIVVNVRVTGDVAEAERALRQVWGGALCVSRAKHTQTRLMRIVERVTKTGAVLSGSVGDDRVDVQVIYDDGSLQRRLDSEYGAGLVHVTSALQPYRE